MDGRRSLVKSRFLTIPCCIVVLLWLMVFAGCQEITEPPPSPSPNDGSGFLSEAQTALALPIETGPILTVTNEYMEPVVTPKYTASMKIPNGVPIRFCWTAKKSSASGAIEAYRYGWDVGDLSDPAEWDVDFTSYNGSKICAPIRTFTWGVHLFVVEAVDDAGASSRVTIAIAIVQGPVSFDVMPGSCKNPLNMQRKGTIRTVIPGRIGFEINEIDVSSLFLWVDGNIVEPLGTKIRDITSPMINRDPCDCPPTNADGIDDLEILFSAQEIIRALGPVTKDDIRDLSIRGELLDGNDFALRDCVTIVGNPRTGEDPALFQKDAVLVALQKAYNEKDFEKAGALFDEDFIFYFSEEDIQNGDVAYAQWGRDDELTATAKLFNVGGSAEALLRSDLFHERFRHARASEGANWGKIKAAFFDGIVDAPTSISLLLLFPQGEEYWAEVAPPDPEQYSGEVWYEKTAEYYMTVQAGDLIFISDVFVRTSFVVRYSETHGHWQIVQWRDDM
jgi:hypothetical protein